MKIIFATTNQNKAIEIQKIVPESIEILSLKDINFESEIPETSPTIEGNAMQKVKFIVDKFAMNCFADDTGLEIDSLNGEPGVYSARYAGLERSDTKNMDLVLTKLSTQTNRKARFKTVIALSINGELNCFEGIVEGQIITEKRGVLGFGYDPIFLPDGFDKTFAEMTIEEKNLISHRGRAFQKMISFLKDKNNG
ncbi:MAG: non-canonical purine NTP diphosphatase [Flavobacteriia bacterium]|nr:non-canonical purine NTP diphosphatase [Flavobacteriia bacterium]